MISEITQHDWQADTPALRVAQKAANGSVQQVAKDWTCPTCHGHMREILSFPDLDLIEVKYWGGDGSHNGSP